MTCQISMQKLKIQKKVDKTVQEEKIHNHDYVDEFLEESIRNSTSYEHRNNEEYDYWKTDHNARISISLSSTLHNTCMNLLFLPERYHISVLYGGADTCALGKGWEILYIRNSRRLNVIGFDHKTAVKRNLLIVCDTTALELLDVTSILLVLHEGMYNDTANHSLFSEFKLREFGIKNDSTYQKYGGNKQMVIQTSIFDIFRTCSLYGSFQTPFSYT
jgi:hypothetical protein